MRLSDFHATRRPSTNQLFNTPGGNGKTVLVTSHIYWTDLIGLALLRLGYNVLFASPWYGFWTDDNWYRDFDKAFAEWVGTIKQLKVMCIIGGNTTAMVPHWKTREPLHRAAGVPVVHYWWDQPRSSPPMARRGVSLTDYVALLKDERTLNVIWDEDVRQELGRYLGVTNTIHSPLATMPELWAEPFVPLQDRVKVACFLGNCHYLSEADRAALEPDLVAWAQAVVAKKTANPNRTIADCIDAGGEAEALVNAADEAALARDFRKWFILDYLLVEAQRGNTVRAMAQKLGDSFTLLGANWDKVGLRAEQAHSGVPGAKTYYASHKASLNLFGGCVHSGMPLRPYDIASANGLIFTHYNRELPKLFEPGKECVAFGNQDEMAEQLDRIMSHPADFNRVVEAGHRRVVQEHTWEHRMKKVMQEVEQRFGGARSVEVFIGEAAKAKSPLRAARIAALGSADSEAVG